MAIATALPGFNDLGHSVTPTFLSRNRFRKIYTLSKNEKKNERGKLKKFQAFSPQDIESCHIVTARCVKLWLLNSNLVFEESHQLTKFT